MKYLKISLFCLIIALWHNSALAAVSCGQPSQQEGKWSLLCSDKTNTTRITHYACIMKIIIETTDPADKAKLIHNATILPNQKDAVVWSEEKFHKNLITSAKLDEFTCYAQD